MTTYFTLVDSYTLADDLTFEHSNPDSVWSCFALGRENARQMRHCISAEMWTRLNLAYLRVQKLSIQEIWDSPESFYEENSDGGRYLCREWPPLPCTATKVGASYRSAVFIERVQLSTSLLLAHLAADTASTGESESDWTSLLRACHAFDAYNRRYSVEVRPRQVMDLLATDSMLPGSLCRSLDMVAAELDALGLGPDARSSADVMRLAGRMAALIRYDWPDQEGIRGDPAAGARARKGAASSRGFRLFRLPCRKTSEHADPWPPPPVTRSVTSPAICMPRRCGAA